MHWQEWSVQPEGCNAIPGKFRLLIINATEPRLLAAAQLQFDVWIAGEKIRQHRY
jgi:hypothetical protein